MKHQQALGISRSSDEAIAGSSLLEKPVQRIPVGSWVEDTSQVKQRKMGLLI
jgi:hypothetical protein